MKVSVTLRDKAGFQKVYEYDAEPESDDSIVFMWEEGNYACDCNRSLFLYDDEERELLCGSEIIKVIQLLVDGVLRYEER